MIDKYAILLGSSSGSADGAANSWLWLVFPILMFVALYFLAIRPQKKKEKEAAQMRNSVDVGDTITTIGGITGRVINVKDEADEIIIETGSDKTKIRIKKWAIASREALEDNEEE